MGMLKRAADELEDVEIRLCFPTWAAWRQGPQARVPLGRRVPGTRYPRPAGTAATWLGAGVGPLAWV